MPFINIKTSDVTLTVHLFESSNTEKLLSVLPFSSVINTWGEEIYFEMPITLEADDTTTNVMVGDVVYWPEGGCMCVFFGRTPMSKSDKPVPASAVVFLGKVTNGLDGLKATEEGERVTVDRAR